jgi:hypothetical protein
MLEDFFDENGELKQEIKDKMKPYFEELALKQDIEYKRAQKLRHYLDERDFDNFIGRIIREHDDDYCDKCYQKGYEPYPNNKYNLLLKLVEIEGEEVKEIDFKDDCVFPNVIMKYKNYYFQWIWGQGVINVIYDENHERIFSI